MSPYLSTTVVETCPTGLILVNTRSATTMPSIRNRLSDPSATSKPSWRRLVKIFECPGFRAAMRETKLHTLKAVLFSILFVLTALFSQSTFAPPSIGTPQ
jgi:hypothetical protein